VKILAIDFGGTLTKCILMINEANEYSEFPSVTENQIEHVLSHFSNPQVEKIVVTGGKSKFLPDIINNIPIIKIDELEAIANFLKSKKVDRGLVVSIGTGTPFVNVDKSTISHVGGTGIGGGTIIGLASRLLNISDITEVNLLAQKGQKTNVNITVKDIVGSGIGIMPETATASNFGKIGGDIEDIAAGIFSLVAESIGVMVALASKLTNQQTIIFVGKTIESSILRDYLSTTLSLYGFTCIFEKKPAYSGVLGALLSVSTENKV
jgi:type II pantothenate kinase